MRAAFLAALLEEARRNPRIVLVNPDTVGFYCEDFRRELPSQYLNTGVAEQNAVGLSAGLALTGRRPFILNIAAFNAFRCYEQVRLDICAMDLPVVLVSVGAGLDYGVFGPSHHAMEDLALMRSLPGMTVWSPAEDAVVAALVGRSVATGGPAYLRLDRNSGPAVHGSAQVELADGLAVLRHGRDLLLAATGCMVRRALEVAEILASASVDAGVVDVFRLKPFPQVLIAELAARYGGVATLEEHAASGGLGTAVLEALAEQGLSRPVRRFGLPDAFCRVCGDRDYMHRMNGLDAASLARRLLDGPLLARR